MIKQLEIKNFRNIPYAMYSFVGNKTVLYGANGIGKSNTLNSLMWLLTGTLLTDKYGVGENDINSIIPKDYQKGQHTEVSIWTELGTKFTKRYKCTYQRGTDRINGHTTELLINDVLQNKISDFEEELWKALDYVPTFKTKDIKELNLFTDPLYALQKLDAEKLRKLLVAIGCSVSNEEVDGYEELISIANKYLGDLDKAAADYKKQANAIEKEITSLESKLETVANVEEFDSTKLDRLNKLKEERISDKVKLKNRQLDASINDINIEISNLKNKRDLDQQAIQNEIQMKLNDVNKDIELECNKLDAAFKEKTTDLKIEIATLENEINSNEMQITNYEKYIAKYDKDINSYIELAKQGRVQKADYSIKLAAIQGKSYDNYITCPHCLESFPLSEEGKAQFERDRANDIQYFRSLIENLQKKDEEYKKMVMDATTEKNAVKVEKDKLFITTEELKKSLENKKKLLSDISHEPEDTSKVDELKNKKAELEHLLYEAKYNFTTYDSDIRALEKKRSDLVMNSEESIKLEIRAIDDVLLDIEDELSAEYVKRSKWAQKQEYQSALDQNVKQLNDVEATRCKIVHFIQKRINMLNERAYQKTGIRFVMAEANLGDGTIKEQTVCYATVNGVPFKDVNTAEKIKVGVNFIAKLKEIAVNDFNVKFNKLPILMDKLECFDSVKKIELLPAYQLVGTAVNECELIDIVCL